MTYTIKTPNELYKGVTEGVPFSKGIGQTEDKNIRNLLVNDYGYVDITEYREENTDSVIKTAEEAGKNTEETAKEVSESLQELSEAGESGEINLNDLTVPELKAEAKRLNLSKYSELTRDELIELIETAP